MFKCVCHAHCCLIQRISPTFFTVLLSQYLGLIGLFLIKGGFEVIVGSNTMRHFIQYSNDSTRLNSTCPLCEFLSHPTLACFPIICAATVTSLTHSFPPHPRDNHSRLPMAPPPMVATLSISLSIFIPTHQTSPVFSITSLVFTFQ